MTSHNLDGYLNRQTKQIEELLEQATEGRRLSDPALSRPCRHPRLRPLAAQRPEAGDDHRSKINLPEEVTLRLLIMRRG